MKKSDLEKLQSRDGHCWHCGATADLVPHHRANRGMGGFRAADTLQNVILVCAQYNGLMESDAELANLAKSLGHKLSKYQSPTQPVFDAFFKVWYLLDEKGHKQVTEPPRYP